MNSRFLTEAKEIEARWIKAGFLTREFIMSQAPKPLFWDDSVASKCDACPVPVDEFQCCDEGCLYADMDDDQPCWGKVDVVASDPVSGVLIHSCEGHKGFHKGVDYVAEDQ